MERLPAGTKLARRVSSSPPARKTAKPKAWRVPADPAPKFEATARWSPARLLILAGVVLLLAGGIVALVVANTSAPPKPAAVAKPSGAASAAPRFIVSSSQLANPATPTTVAPAPTQPAAVGGAPLPSSAASGVPAGVEPQYTPAPPVPVQQVSPATGPGAASPRRSAAASASARPQVSLPGAIQQPSSAPAAAPSPPSNGIAGDIQSDLNAINASATVLAQAAGPTSSSATGSSSVSPPPSDTPIPTASPPFVPTP
ncbi:MAG TPA: hypothetical protein VFS62_13370 [Chloroflexota bacterium]|nr:hypothetical protein [Chloroflexota bacterium]